MEKDNENEFMSGIRATGGMIGPNGEVTHYQISDDDANPVLTFGSSERPGASPMYVRDLRHALHYHYHIEPPEGGWRSIDSFTLQERAKLRPVAETLAMLDGNAFFGMQGEKGTEHYEYYLAEASALYERNGGDNGWAGLASFARSDKEQA